MLQQLISEKKLDDFYQTINKEEYSLLLCQIKNMNLLRTIYDENCEQTLWEGVQYAFTQVLSIDDYVYYINKEEVVIFLKTQSPYDIIRNIYELDKIIETYTFQNIHHTISLAIGIFLLCSSIPFFKACEAARFAMLTSFDFPKYNTSFEFYDAQKAEHLTYNFQMLAKLEKAFDKQEFHIYLQSKVDPQTHMVKEAEALIRWIHEGKEVPLHEFMPLVDKNTFIRRIDLYIYEEVCKLLNCWKKKGIPLIPISINVSRASFEDGVYYIKGLEDISLSYGVDKTFIEFELSEEICFSDTHHLHRFLQLLKENGYACSLDDFGSGYSSFLTLTYLPVRTIKLDSAFCLGEWNKKKKVIMKYLLALLNDLDLAIIVEGVETKEVAEFFENQSCFLLQGFYFCKPISIPEFEIYYKNTNGL